MRSRSLRGAFVLLAVACAPLGERTSHANAGERPPASAASPSPLPPSPTEPAMTNATDEDRARAAAAGPLGIAPAAVRLEALAPGLPFPNFRATNPGLGMGPRPAQQGIGVLVVEGKALVGRAGFTDFLASAFRSQPYALACAWLYLWKGDPGTIRGSENYDSGIKDPMFEGDTLRVTYTSAFGRTPTYRVGLGIGADGSPVADEQPVQ